MPNGKAHAVLGAVSGGGVAACFALADERGNLLLEGLGGIAGGYLGGLLPDLLEPSKGNPQHRRHCHSWTAGGVDVGVAVAWLRCVQPGLRRKADEHREAARLGQDLWQWLWHWIVYIGLHLVSGLVAGLTAGFASHLVADATTTAGLPAV